MPSARNAHQPRAALEHHEAANDRQNHPGYDQSDSGGQYTPDQQRRAAPIEQYIANKPDLPPALVNVAGHVHQRFRKKYPTHIASSASNASINPPERNSGLPSQSHTATKKATISQPRNRNVRRSSRKAPRS